MRSEVFVNLAAFGITEGCFRDDCQLSQHGEKPFL